MIKEFKDIKDDFQNEVGGKAFNLAKLKKFGLNVPNGFVVTDYSGTDSENEQIFNLFDKLKMTSVAVRSSAICEDGSATSFAGQFETLLFVKKENLISSIQTCMNSNQNENAVYYAKSNNISEADTKVSVVIQEMISSEYSGVLFTQNPISDEDECLIECIKGVGEALVQGEITPSQIRLKKLNGEVLSYIGENFLGPEQIKELYDAGLHIEKCFGSPQDIEFAVENDTLYIIQARPITTI